MRKTKRKIYIHEPDAALRRETEMFSELPIVVHLVGAGGTGSQMLTGLARLHTALVALDKPGLKVIVFDPDRVSEANVGRQLYYRSDIGQSKAITLVHRVNCCFGLAWKALTDRYTGEQASSADILITCVDTAAARRDIAKNLVNASGPPLSYWLDCGNARRTGQVFLARGNMRSVWTQLVDGGETHSVDLPHLWQILPEVFDENEPEDDTPSCSLAEALRSQDLFINDHVSRWALHLLWVLLTEKQLSVHGYWINLEDGRVLPVPVPAPCQPGADLNRRCKGGTNG